MWAIYKIIRNFVRALVADNRPWQVAGGVFLGVALGFLPFFAWEYGVAWPAGLLLLLALVINVHLGSVLLFFGLGSVAWALLIPVAEGLGAALQGFAETAAGVPLLHAAGLSHTGALGMTIIGLPAAVITSLVMWRTTIVFRTRVLPRLRERRRLATVGTVAGNGLVARTLLWFFGL